MSAGQYRPKAIVIEAMQNDGYNHDEMAEWSDGRICNAKPWKDSYSVALVATSLYGADDLHFGDWVIKYPNGILEVLTRQDFEATFEAVNVSA